MMKNINFRFPIKVQGEQLHSIISTKVDTSAEELNKEIEKKTDKATTLAGYGITDAYTKSEANDAITTEVAKIVADAPEDFDTLKEVADWIKSDTTGAAKMQSDITALKNQIIVGTEELEDGVSTLEKGKLYFVLES